MNTHQELLSRLPSIDALLRDDRVGALLAPYRRELSRRWLERILEKVRSEIRQETIPAGATRADFIDRAGRELRLLLDQFQRLGIRRVINATGVIIHTNLGRSPIARDILSGIPDHLDGYTNLEYDLDSGHRGHRDTQLARLLTELLPCQDATAVNNNAAALLLILHALANGGEVVVSRGELVEIGGSFRVPDIMAQSGARLREVGTTNRTRASDYAAAIGPATRLILQVHRSNFEITGFTETPPLAELIALSNQTGIPLVADAGSGYLFEVPGLGIGPEPVIDSTLRAGASLVCFSGDKLLGGTQAGLVLGRADLIARLRKDPLMRAVRLDKVILHLLAETIKGYFRSDFATRLPHLAMATAPPPLLRRRCQALRRRWLKSLPEWRDMLRVVPGQSVIGGGSTPGQKLPGFVLSWEVGEDRAAMVERLLRSGEPPVIARIEAGALLFDLRTVAPREERDLLARLLAAGEALRE